MEHPALDELRRRAFDYLPIPVVIIDADAHCLIDANFAAIEMYGFASKEELMGKSTADVSA
jgi:PAS domain-containing protein